MLPFSFDPKWLADSPASNKPFEPDREKLPPMMRQYLENVARNDKLYADYDGDPYDDDEMGCPCSIENGEHGCY